MSTSRPLKKSQGDAVHASVKAALSIIPVVGGPLTELFAYVIEEPVSKRRDAWISEIAGRLENLRSQLGDDFIEQLRENPRFATALLQANQIAVRNHQREKIEALANAVLNTALGMSPDETEESIMLDFIDRLTPTHIALLKLFQNPRSNRTVVERMQHTMTGGLTQVILAAYPELQGRSDLMSLMWRDLESAGLFGQGNVLNVTMSGSGLLEKRTTAFGDRFLAFIARNDTQRNAN